MSSYDAVVFNMNVLHYSGKLPWNEADYWRNPKQRFVFMSMEPPMLTWGGSGQNKTEVNLYENYFNWSMSFRFDSDVQFTYGLTKLKNKSSDFKPFAKKKSSPNQPIVVWMASNCAAFSRREDYVKEMKRFIKVDSYGKCGDLKCDKNKTTESSPEECYRMMESKYKFYLSFENSFCTDYVTEKFFYILSYDMIPVVYGAANYSRIAPPHSFIDARQFKGPKELAYYLIALDANDVLYNEYFAWKNHYTVENGLEKMALNGMCNLCRKLHQKNNGPKVYSELVNHWLPEHQCTQPKPFDVSPAIEEIQKTNSSINWKTVNVDKLQPKQIIEYFNWSNRSSCQLIHDFGGFMLKRNGISGFDGQKAICLDAPVRPPEGNCIVYSFGINNEWSFDETMEKYGCRVFSFDPSMNVNNHNRTDRIHFFNLGLAGRDYVNVQNWSLKTLSSINEMLAPYHGKDAVIDYLKMDIESAEWEAIPQIVSSGMMAKVRQLGVEIHLSGNRALSHYRNLVGIIKSIEDTGMVRFDSKYNPWYLGGIEALDHYNGPLGFEIAFYRTL